MSDQAVYTIGHSTLPTEHFVQLLKRNRITAIADVRSSPYSRLNPQFNREQLRADLSADGITYVFLGDLLGARPKNRDCYREGRVDYALVAKTKEFLKGLERIRVGSRTYKIAMMCAEKEPLDCHRTILIARELARLGTRVLHILPDGSAESHEDSLKRLLRVTLGDNRELFASSEQLLEEAYERRAQEIAYADESARDTASAS